MSATSIDKHNNAVAPPVGEPFCAPRDADELWRLFLADKVENTRVNHEGDLRCFASFVGASTIEEALKRFLRCDAAEANKTILAYQAWLYQVCLYKRGDDPETSDPVQIGYAPATVNRRIYALRAVAELANATGLITWQVKVKLRSPEPTRDTRGCGTQGYLAIVDALERAVAEARQAPSSRDLVLALRDRALIRLLHDGGLRRKEAVGIEWPGGVRLETFEVKVLGKGRKRPVWQPIGQLCATAIGEYLPVRGQTRGPLLCSTHPAHRGRGLALSTVNRRVAYWAARAQQRVTPHGLRHTAATRALDLTQGNYRLVASWSRHRNPQSLRPYDDRRREFARDLVDAIADPDKSLPDQLPPVGGKNEPE